jgi:multicomponent Na+:H+ antiporter subunit D
MVTLIGGVSELYQSDMDLGRHVVDRLDLAAPGTYVEDLSYGAIPFTHRLQELRPDVLVLVGAVSRDRIESVLAYSSIGQIGFIAIPIAIAAGTTSASLQHLGILAALIYALHHALAKGLLFLAAGTIRNATGTTVMAELGGLGERSQLFSATVLVGSLSLVGIPPLTGFFGKLLVFEVGAAQYAGTPTASSAALIGVLLAGAVLTIVYMTRVWVGGFWGSQTERVETATVDPRQVGLLATLAALIVLGGVGFDPLYRFAETAATAAIDTDAYVDIVEIGGEP